MHSLQPHTLACDQELACSSCCQHLHVPSWKNGTLAPEWTWQNRARTWKRAGHVVMCHSFQDAAAAAYCWGLPQHPTTVKTWKTGGLQHTSHWQAHSWPLLHVPLPHINPI